MMPRLGSRLFASALLLACQGVGVLAANCEITILAESVSDGEPIPYSAVRLVDSKFGQIVWEGKGDGSGISVIPVPINQHQYWIDVHMPGFEISTAKIQCDNGLPQNAIVTMRDINAFGRQGKLGREPQRYFGKRVGVCGSLDLGADDMTLRVHDAWDAPALDDALLLVTASAGALERAQSRWSGYACVDGVFARTPGDLYTGHLSVENVWWVGCLTQP